MTSAALKLPFLTSFLPDEALYGWTGRYHLLSGNASEDVTRWQLYGSAQAGRHFHVPSHLVALSARSRLVLGKPAVLAAKATTLPYYLRFRDATVAEKAIQAVFGGVTSGLIQTLGIGKSGAHFPIPRRSCRECIQKDQAEHGIAYWHRSHQLPGTLVCADHGETLWTVPLTRNHKRKISYVWPEDDLLSATGCESGHFSEADRFGLLRLAHLSKQMLCDELFGPLVERNTLQAACIAALKDHGLTSVTGEIRFDEAQRRYSAHFKQISGIPDIAAALSTLSVRPLDAICRGVRAHLHPLEYMLMIDWLFGSWESFIRYWRDPSNR